MFPHERSLVEKMKDEPFALVGVNSDKDFAEKKEKEFKDEKIVWRSFQNSPPADKPTDKPAPSAPSISDKWHIQSWPSLFLLDAEGKIRNKWIGAPDGEALDKEIEALVAETKAKAARGAKPAPKKKTKN